MERKQPDERRAQIVDAALRLFHEQGYETVRVEDILEAVSLSKGGFYHHFESKEHLLRAIVRQEVSAILTTATGQIVDPVAELIGVLERGSSQAGADLGVLETLTSFGSRTAYLDELEDQFERHLKPVIDRIVACGVSLGAFRVVDSTATAEVFLAVNNHGNRLAVLKDRTSQELASFSAAALEILGRHLGIETELGRVAAEIIKRTNM